MPRSLESLRRDVARWRREAGDLLAKADAVEALLNQLVAAAKHGEKRSTIRAAARDVRDNPATMTTTAVDHGEKHDARIAAVTVAAHRDATHPFLRWLGDKSVAKWAKENGYTRARVQSWLLPKGRGRRAIPMPIAEQIERESEGSVPVSTWHTRTR